MLLGETVPRFRRDLKIQRKGESGGLYEVSDPTTDKHFTLYDIELSIARMLDGHRTVQEVIEAGTKIGIPITLESLEKFERQLTAYGFLQSGDAAAAGDAWAPREEWAPELREMFRSVLLKYRQNRFDEAIGYLKAMLAIDPDNKEAKEVLASCEVKKKKAGPAPDEAPVFAPVLSSPEAKVPSPAPSPAPAPSPSAGARSSGVRIGVMSPASPSSSASSLPPVSDSAAKPARSSGARSALSSPTPSPAAAEAPSSEAAPEPVAAPAPSTEVPPADAPVSGDVPPAEAAPPGEPPPAAEPQPAPSPLPQWTIPATGGAVALVVLLMVPLPRSIHANVVLEAPNALVVKAPRDVVVQEAAVAPGAAVQQGAVLYKLDGSDAMGHLKPYDAKVAALNVQLAEAHRSTSKKQIASWQKTVKHVEGEIEKAKAALAKASSDKARAAAQKKVADKERELLEANAELRDATKVDAVAKLKQQLEEATAAREKAAAEEAVLVSPAPGVVTDLSAKPGEHVASGSPVAHVADVHELTVACNVDAADALLLAAGQEISATLKGQSVALQVESIEGSRASAKLVQAQQPAFIPGDTGEAKIAVGARSLLGRLFH